MSNNVSKTFDFHSTARYWHTLATADARDLIPVACCRYCHGFDHAYQYTLNEFREALFQHRREQMSYPAAERVPFDERGGDGYDPYLPPHPDCPECRGHGRIEMGLFDPKSLSPAAAMLFDGLLQRKDGSVELRVRDRSHAMVNFQRLMGYEIDRKQVQLKEYDPKQLSDDEMALALTRSQEVLDLSPTEFEEIVGAKGG